MLHHRIRHDNRISRRHRHIFQNLDRAEITEDQRILPAENRTELIQQSRLQSHIFILHSLPHPRPVGFRKINAVNRLESKTECHFQRGGTAHSRGQRNGAPEHRIERAEPDTAAAQLHQRTLEIVCPVALAGRIHIVKINFELAGKRTVYKSADGTFLRSHSERGRLRHSGTQDIALIVVRMVAENLQPSGSTGEHRGFSAEMRFKNLFQWFHFHSLC